MLCFMLELKVDNRSAEEDMAEIRDANVGEKISWQRNHGESGGWAAIYGGDCTELGV